VGQQKLKCELLFQIVRTADSYCVKAIVSEICALAEDNSKLYYCLKLADYLMSAAEI